MKSKARKTQVGQKQFKHIWSTYLQIQSFWPSYLTASPREQSIDPWAPSIIFHSPIFRSCGLHSPTFCCRSSLFIILFILLILSAHMRPTRVRFRYIIVVFFIAVIVITVIVIFVVIIT